MIDNEILDQLFAACRDSDITSVKSILSQINISARNIKANDGFGLMHIATVANKKDIINFLVAECEVDPHLAEKEYGYTPLHIAAKFNKLNAIRCLVEDYKADIECKTNSGQTPLMCAATHASLEAICYLIEICKANMHEISSSGKTFFDYVKQNSNHDVIEYATKLANLTAV